MTKTFALALTLAVTLALASHAEALSPTCLSLPLPTAPLLPNYALDIFSSSNERAAATFWRQPCQDGSGEVAVLIRLTATVGSPFVCGGVIVQNGIQRDARLVTATSSGASSFCGELFVPTSVVLVSGLFQVDYDETAAFTYINSGAQTTTVEIPAVAVQPPAGPPTIAVVPLGCTTCHPGNTLGFELHVTNPGAPMLVELKTGARLPGGAVVSILGRHEEEVVASGVTVIPLFAGFVLPAGIPAGAYTIEAALLEPELGVTISRSSVALILGP